MAPSHPPRCNTSQAHRHQANGKHTPKTNLIYNGAIFLLRLEPRALCALTESTRTRTRSTRTLATRASAVTTAASSFAPSLFFASPRSPYAIFFSFLFSFLSVFFFILRLRAASSVTCLPRPMLLYLSSSFSFSLLLILKYQPLHKHKLHDKGHHAGVQYCDCISGVCTPLEMGGGNVCGSSSNSRCVCHVEQKPSMPSPGTKLIAVLP